MSSIAQPSRPERFSPAPSDQSPIPAEIVTVKAGFDQLKKLIADCIAQSEQPIQQNGFKNPNFDLRREYFRAIKVFQRHYYRGLEKSQQLFLDFFETGSSTSRCKVEIELFEMQLRIKQKVSADPNLSQDQIYKEFDRQEEMMDADHATNHIFQQGVTNLYNTLQPLVAERSQTNQ